MTRTTQTIVPIRGAALPDFADAIVHVDPADVTIEENVRMDYTAEDLDKSFLATIKANGVLVPPIGYQDAEGRVFVRAGQRRVLAAQTAGLFPLSCPIGSSSN